MSRRKGSSRVWRWRQALGTSSLKPGTQYILLKLSQWMSPDGDNCYPSVETIAKVSKRDRKTVITHLRLAEEAGWIHISNAGLPGRRWKRDQYQARWPEEIANQHDASVQASNNWPGEPVEEQTEGGGNASPDAVENFHRVYENPPLNPPNISPEAGDARERVGAGERLEADALFCRFRAQHPTRAVDDKERVREAFDACTNAQQHAGVEMHTSWLRHLEELDYSYIPGGFRYWRDRLWEGLPIYTEKQPAKTGCIEAKPWTAPWWAALLVAARQGDTRRVSYIRQMLREHGCCIVLDPSRERDQLVISMLDRFVRVSTRRKDFGQIRVWFAKTMRQSLPELPAAIEWVYVPDKALRKEWGVEH